MSSSINTANSDGKARASFPLEKPILSRQIGYVKVDQDGRQTFVLDDEKSIAAPLVNKGLTVSDVRSAAGRAMQGKNVRARVRLCHHVTLTGSANTVFSTVSSLTPGSCAEFNNFALLYDKCRCRKVDLDYSVTVTAGSPSGAGLATHGVVTFDPATAGALSSMEQGRGFTHADPIFTAVAYLGTHVPIEGRGMFRMKHPLKPAVATFESGITADLVGGSWFPCTASSTAIVGYIKPYIEAGGSGVVFTVAYNIEYDMEFATRG